VSWLGNVVPGPTQSFRSQIDYVRSNRARVARALEEDRNGFQHRFYPAFLGSSHKSRALIEHTGVVSSYEIFVLILLFYGNRGTKFQNAGRECDTDRMLPLLISQQTHHRIEVKSRLKDQACISRYSFRSASQNGIVRLNNAA
jgi:hypothetical protein